MTKSRDRIFIGPSEIAGQYRNLALSLLERDIDCEYYTFYQNNFNYGGDIGSSKIPRLMRKLNFFGKKHNIIVRILSIAFYEMLRFIFFATHFYKYETFYFGFGISLLRGNIDLPILKILRKRIIANLAHGSEMTPCYLDGALMDSTMEMPSIKELIKCTKRKKNSIKKFEIFADVIIGSPLSSSFLATKPYVDIIRLGRTCQAQNKADLRNIRIQKKTKNVNLELKKINIIHIPSHAPGKGTYLIREVMKKIIAEYDFVDYNEISGLSNTEVLNRLTDADLLIDQAYSDLPLSGIGMEAFVLGIPVLLSGYGLLDLKNRYSSEMFPPTIICHPSQLADKIRSILNTPNALEEIGAKGKKFVDTIWSKEAVSQRYIPLLTGDCFPVDWWHDPAAYLYLYGYGLPEEKVKSIINEIKTEYGVSQLSLSHRPDLLRALLNYSESK
jgi:glycosyltransferase involved in cell wall biosynthesis